jgi:hypothetical protein
MSAGPVIEMWLVPVIGGAAPPGNKVIAARNPKPAELVAADRSHCQAVTTVKRLPRAAELRRYAMRGELLESWWIARHSIHRRLLFRKRSFTLTSTSKFNEELSMNELVTRVAENVGLEPATAEKAVGMILGFLQREAADGPVAQMIESIPGATDLIAQYNGEGTGGGGLLGGLMSAIGGGGVMALGQQLMSQGLGMGEITSLAKETIAFAKEKAGADVVDEVVASVPGLSQFV